jgi:hypothetical protein
MAENCYFYPDVCERKLKNSSENPVDRHTTFFINFRLTVACTIHERALIYVSIKFSLPSPYEISFRLMSMKFLSAFSRKKRSFCV